MNKPRITIQGDDLDTVFVDRREDNKEILELSQENEVSQETDFIFLSPSMRDRLIEILIAERDKS